MSLLDRLRRLVGGGQPSSPAQPQSQPMTLDAFISKLFTGHGIDTSLHEGWIVPTVGPPLQAEFVKETVREANADVQLDVRVALPDGRLLIESFAGIGENLAAAKRDAAQAFTTASFHVIFKALHDPRDAHQETEDWTINGSPRLVVPSGATLRGDIESARGAVDCMAAFDDILRQSKLSHGLHWVRTYYAQQSAARLGSEVLLDNEEWSDLAAQWRALPWPPAEKFYSVRRFLIIQDSAHSETGL